MQASNRRRFLLRLDYRFPRLSGFNMGIHHTGADMDYRQGCKGLASVGIALLTAGCADLGGVQLGGERSGTVASGSAGGSTATQPHAQLERCDATLGTVAIMEDQNSRWYYTLSREYKLQSTVPLIRLLVQQSNCFVVVERGRAFNQMNQERAIDRSGEARAGSNFGPGQMVSADYTMTPEISFSQKDAGGIGAAVGRYSRALGIAGSMAGNVKFREAATSLILSDNRSGVQLAAAEGSASKTDFGGWSGALGGLGAVGGGAYSNTAEGKLLTGAFADAYNQLVRSVRSYKAQEVRGGLGTGGHLGVQGGATPAARGIPSR